MIWGYSLISFIRCTPWQKLLWIAITSPAKLNNNERLTGPQKLNNSERLTGPQKANNSERLTGPQKVSNSERLTGPPKLNNSERLNSLYSNNQFYLINAQLLQIPVSILQSTAHKFGRWAINAHKLANSKPLQD
jgi:hypothetical protein